MSCTPTQTLERYRAFAVASAALPSDATSYSGLSEAQLLEINQLRAAGEHNSSAGGALIAGEVVHRSAPALGSQGLAQKTGHRTPADFIKATTGADAVKAVRVGSLMHGGAGGEDHRDEAVVRDRDRNRPHRGATRAGRDVDRDASGV